MVKQPRKRWAHRDIYGIWSHMMRRCYEPTAIGYKHYGGRGIKVCERWHSFQNFFADVRPRPPGMSIDRIDTNGDYAPDNFRWADMDTQIRNRRYTVFLTHNGETMCMKDWARKLGMKYQTLRERIRRGWPHELALTTPATFANGGSMKFERLTPQNQIVIRDHWPTECSRGHALTPDNSRYGSSGKPYCKRCETAKGRMRAGWPEHLAYSVPILPFGREIDKTTGLIATKKAYRRKRLQNSAGGSPDV